MSVFTKLKWEQFHCSKKELRLDITLKCGQSFRWKLLEDNKDQLYIGVVSNRLLVFKQDEESVYYSSPSTPVQESLVKEYFNLGVNLEQLYQTWSKVDPIFLEISKNYPGVRMLRQDPVENIFSFICSANNNIQRITSMVENMCKECGELVCEFNGVSYYSFPSLEALSQAGVEEKLRVLGFGYRAKYIEESAKKILALGGEPWAHSLRKMEYKEAKANLLTLPGIGPKVADCILLMSLDQPSSVPVDTHVFQIAKKYLPHLLSVKTVTAKVYTEIGDHFRGLYGEYAGWAHSVLFSADLRHLQGLKQDPGQGEIKQEPVEEKIREKKSKSAKDKKTDNKEENKTIYKRIKKTESIPAKKSKK